MVQGEVIDLLIDSVSVCVNTDCFFLIPSTANINDRSQVGFRDSEIAIIIEDTDMVASRMNGEPVSLSLLVSYVIEKSSSQRTKFLLINIFIHCAPV